MADLAVDDASLVWRLVLARLQANAWVDTGPPRPGRDCLFLTWARVKRFEAALPRSARRVRPHQQVRGVHPPVCAVAWGT